MTPPNPFRDVTDHAFRDAMRQLASGVCVVTSGSGQDRTGLTATSIGPLSTDPPTLLVCVEQASSSTRVLQCARCICGQRARGRSTRDRRSLCARVRAHWRGSGFAKDVGWFCRAGLPISPAQSPSSTARRTSDLSGTPTTIVIGRIRRVLIGDGSARWSAGKAHTMRWVGARTRLRGQSVSLRALRRGGE